MHKYRSREPQTDNTVLKMLVLEMSCEAIEAFLQRFKKQNGIGKTPDAISKQI